MPVMVNS